MATGRVSFFITEKNIRIICRYLVNKQNRLRAPAQHGSAIKGKLIIRTYQEVYYIQPTIKSVQLFSHENVNNFQF